MTEPTPSAPDAPADSVTRLLAAKPKLLPVLLLVLAVLCLIPVFVYGGSAFLTATPPPTAEGEPPVEALNVYKAEHITYTVAGIVAAIVLGCLALLSLAGSATPTASEARKSLLLDGSVLGFLLMLFGMVLLLLWFSSIGKWLNDGVTSEAHRVLIPVGVVILGAAVTILAALPARAEERNNQTHRRFIYGANLGVTTLLLLFALIAGNIFLALRVPNKLDTTGSGFYTLGDDTVKYLKALDTPITAYTTMTDGGYRESSDMRRLLDNAATVNPARFIVKEVSPVNSKPLLTSLRKRYPQHDFNAPGGWVLLAAGEDESRTTFFTLRDVVQRDKSGESFTGETRLIRDVLFLADAKAKPVVYFTQGHGELSILPANPQTSSNRTANTLKALLEKNYIDVRTWTPEVSEPKVPDDAAAVIIADPRLTIPAKTVQALAAYMNSTRAGGKVGKLILLTSPWPKPNGTGVAETGLEGILLNYGVALGKGYLLAPNDPRELTMNEIESRPTNDALKSRQPIVAGITVAPVLRDCRPLVVTPVPDDPDAVMTIVPLLESISPQDNFTFIDPEPPVDPEKQWNLLAQDREGALRKKYSFTRKPWPLAVAVAESKQTRLVVFGSGVAFADNDSPRSPPPRIDLIAASLDWLRDRPTVAAANKSYSSYTLPKTASAAKLIWLPILLTLVAILIAGLGIWVVRRR